MNMVYRMIRSLEKPLHIQRYPRRGKSVLSRHYVHTLLGYVVSLSTSSNQFNQNSKQKHEIGTKFVETRTSYDSV